MKVAMMQPYFFPYLGYFQLIHAVDRFILSDNVQYIKQGWINRNRIQNQDFGWQYIIAPLAKHSSSALIKDVYVVDGFTWKQKIMSQLSFYKRKALFYKKVIDLVSYCFNSNENNIAIINAEILQAVCDFIGIDFKIEFDSEIGFDYSAINSTSERPLRCKQINATEYINPIGGVNLYSKDELQEYDLKLSFLQPDLERYYQGRNEFEPGLSIIDVLMFNSCQDVKAMMGKYQLV